MQLVWHQAQVTPTKVSLIFLHLPFILLHYGLVCWLNLFCVLVACCILQVKWCKFCDEQAQGMSASSLSDKIMLECQNETCVCTHRYKHICTMSLGLRQGVDLLVIQALILMR